MTKGYHYQLDGYRQLENFGGNGLLADDMGLGKTFQFLLYLHMNTGFPGGVRRCVVICPAGLKVNWQREALMHFNIHAEICEGREPKQRRHKFTQLLVLINYEILPGWLPTLLKWKPDLLGLDEAHRIQNRSSLTYECVDELAENIPRVICLSGTPLTNRPAELWTILNLVRPDKYRSFLRFAWRYCQPKRNYGKWEFKGATRLPELHRRAKRHCMIRRLKRDVLKDLPKSHTSTVLVDIEKRKQYDKAHADYLKWLQGTAPGKHARASRSAGRGKMVHLKQMVGTLKWKAIIDWIDNFMVETDEKLLVFGVHKALLKRLHERYKRFHAVLINSTVTGKKRQQSIDQFQLQKSCRLLFANHQSGGEGFNMTAAAYGLVIEFPWTPKEINQTRARNDRIGQTRETTWYFMIAKNTMEEKLVTLLNKKQKIVDATLDGENVEAFDVYDELMEAMYEEL